MTGEEVLAVTVTAWGTDELGNRVPSETEEAAIANVLVAPGSAAATGGDNRPDGTWERYTLYMPRGVETEAREFVVRGTRCRAVGEPARWPDSPTDWCAVIEVEATHG